MAGGETHTVVTRRQGTGGERGSSVGGAGGGCAAGAAGDVTSETPAFEEEVGEEEEASWATALAALEEDETLEKERIELVQDEMMLARASMSLDPEDLETHVQENTQHDPSAGSAEYHVFPRRD
eukprot:SAG11_NODE_2016_length_3919_cov_4.215445_8_plen_124_part_00